MSCGEDISAQQAYDQFWPKAVDEIRSMETASLKHQELPLARIKKIMKLDEDVKMISAEAPVLFAKAAEIFIHELTMRAWIHTEDNKRRTLQRNDIAMAISKYDQFDFLIDIVPREDIKPPTAKSSRQEASNNCTSSTTSSAGGTTTSSSSAAAAVTANNVNAIRVVPDQLSYYFQAQQPQQPNALQPQVIQLQATQMVNAVAPPPAGGIQIVQQLIGPNGEIQQIPIQLTAQQMQLIRAQMTSNLQQPLVIQTAPIQTATISAAAATSQSQPSAQTQQAGQTMQL